MIKIKRVTEFAELEGIRNLQKENLKPNLTEAEINAEGFVTAEYSLNFLQLMHEAGPSIIAKDGELVVGYALVADRSICHHHDLLADLFNTINNTVYRGKLLKDTSYVVVGQLAFQNITAEWDWCNRCTSIIRIVCLASLTVALLILYNKIKDP